MTERKREIIDSSGETVIVHLRRDKRLRKYARASLEDGHILVRVPPGVPDSEADQLADDLATRLLKRRVRSRRLEDSDLTQRAVRLNEKCFDDQLSWNSIRWVGNMNRRLGSCTSGGFTDGDIRISDRIRSWPDWVIDYIIAHEIVHRAHPNHSPAFWDMLSNYPHTERARGFIAGVEYGRKLQSDAD